MRNLLLLGTLIVLTSCGAINDECGSDIRMGCNTVFGEIHDSSTDVAVLNDSTADLRQQLADLIDSTESELDSLEYEILNLNEAILDLETELVEIINPCGRFDSRDEILLRIGTDFVAVMNRSGRRYLVDLTDGNYITEDGDRCRFSISNGVYSE